MVSSLMLFTLVMPIDCLTYPLEVLSWGTLALIPVAFETFPIQMACILFSNLGASITEVASDALVAELNKKHKVGELQSYAFMALAAGGIIGNLSGGLVLQKTQQPKIMFLIFSFLLSFQLAASLTTRENSLDSQQSSGHHPIQKSISANLSKQFSDLITALSEESIFHPLSWVVASIAVVPMLSGTTFCYQTQCLKIDPSTIGMSKVIGQMMVLSATVFYNRYMKRLPIRQLICGLQIMYAFSILFDLFLVKQINLKLGISNEAYVLCLSPLAEALAQFKILPFSVLFANLCPPGCEGSLIAFMASALCLSSIFSGFFGVGLCYLFGISSVDYSNLPVGILFQFFAALMPLGWLFKIPISQTVGKKWKRNKRSRRVAVLPSGYEGVCVKPQQTGKES
ncbi:putative folate-biopterin transporter 9, chloroplastic isoform X2 [Tasmannia lanceolata]|uniref:putative folate-biopterin transporter 9, chloroplastic isoform X2 n=1 Tax=Tasmannia lanceolata TaxID=3420 RepID=UPI004062A436